MEMISLQHAADHDMLVDEVNSIVAEEVVDGTSDLYRHFFFPVSYYWLECNICFLQTYKIQL